MNHDIFLSYRRSDQELAGALVEALETRGLTVWWDQKIEGGIDWRDAIAGNLEKAETLVILFSEDCNNSRQLRKELAMADVMEKDVIPVLIEDTRPKGHFLYELASRNWVRVFPNPMAKLDELADRLAEQEFGPKGGPREESQTDNAAGGVGSGPVPAVSRVKPRKKIERKAEPVGDKEYRDFLPFKWYEIAALIAMFALALYGFLLNDEGTAIEELTEQEFWDTTIGFFAIAWLYGVVVFPIRYFRRGRRLRRAILYFVLSTGTLAIVTGLVWLGDPSFNEVWAEGDGENAMVGMIGGMIGLWILTAIVAFAIYGAMIGGRVIRKWNSHVETI
ncbi:MAG: toll/interleukin-1 receptor domain-containing protein [Pseudomonadota bacterium]